MITRILQGKNITGKFISFGSNPMIYEEHLYKVVEENGYITELYDLTALGILTEELENQLDNRCKGADCTKCIFAVKERHTICPPFAKEETQKDIVIGCDLCIKKEIE